MTATDKLGKIIAKAITWAFAGALYGGFYAGLLAYFHTIEIGHWTAFILSSAIAGLVIAAFFGSMLVALGGTLTGILAAISYQILLAHTEQPVILFAGAFILGAVAGAFFTRREIKQSQPIAQATAGLLAGLISGPIMALATLGIHPYTDHWGVAAGSVSLVGLGYVFFSKHTPGLLRNKLSMKLGGPLVSGIVAMAMASVFWIIGESSLAMPHLGEISNYQSILDNAPLGLLGGALGGAFGGAMLEILGIKLEEHIN
jgi:hypothetical protein